MQGTQSHFPFKACVCRAEKKRATPGLCTEWILETYCLLVNIFSRSFFLKVLRYNETIVFRCWLWLSEWKWNDTAIHNIPAQYTKVNEKNHGQMTVRRVWSPFHKSPVRVCIHFMCFCYLAQTWNSHMIENFGKKPADYISWSQINLSYDKKAAYQYLTQNIHLSNLLQPYQQTREFLSLWWGNISRSWAIPNRLGHPSNLHCWLELSPFHRVQQLLEFALSLRWVNLQETAIQEIAP